MSRAWWSTPSLAGKGNYGFNAANDTYGDMIEMGILDPTKVTRTALQNAASVARPDAHHRSHDRRSAEDDAAMPGGGGWVEWAEHGRWAL